MITHEYLRALLSKLADDGGSKALFQGPFPRDSLLFVLRLPIEREMLSK